MSQEIRTLVFEKNEESLAHLSKLLMEISSEINILGTADNIIDAIYLIEKVDPHIVFMDVDLKDGDTFGLLKKLDNINFEIVITSSIDDYIDKATEYFAFHHILKPVNRKKLSTIVNRYQKLRDRFSNNNTIESPLNSIYNNNRKLLLHTGNEHLVIGVDEIIKCEADGNYTSVHLEDKNYLVSKPIKHYEKLLTNMGFFRANRSVLLNINHIKSISKKETIILNNNEKIVVSRRNKLNLSGLINRLS